MLSVIASAKLKLLPSTLTSLFPPKASWLPTCLRKGWAGHGPGRDLLLRVLWIKLLWEPSQCINGFKARVPTSSLRRQPPRATVQLLFLLQLLAFISIFHISLSEPHLFGIKSCCCLPYEHLKFELFFSCLSFSEFNCFLYKMVVSIDTLDIIYHSFLDIQFFPMNYPTICHICLRPWFLHPYHCYTEHFNTVVLTCHLDKLPCSLYTAFNPHDGTLVQPVLSSNMVHCMSILGFCTDNCWKL